MPEIRPSAFTLPVRGSGGAQTLGFVVGGDLLGRRDLDEMSIAELEARVKMNEERLRLARQIGWLGGFGGGVAGVLGVAKMIK